MYLIWHDWLPSSLSKVPIVYFIIQDEKINGFLINTKTRNAKHF